MTIEEMIQRLVGSEPNRVIISFNDHWTCYETIEDERLSGYRWISDAERAKGIATDSAWDIRVDGLEAEFPYVVRATASTLRAALEEAVRQHLTEPSDWAGDMQCIEQWINWVRPMNGHTFAAEFNADGADTLNCWEVIYYPNTPVGHCRASAPRLDQAICYLGGHTDPLRKPWLNPPF